MSNSNIIKLNNVFPLISEEYRIQLYKFFEANGLSIEYMHKSFYRKDNRISYVAVRHGNINNTFMLRQGSMLSVDIYSNSNPNDNIVYLLSNIIDEDLTI